MNSRASDFLTLGGCVGAVNPDKGELRHTKGERIVKEIRIEEINPTLIRDKNFDACPRDFYQAAG
ncbi:MAG: hypothetical protein WCO08_02940 [Actinomycetes bacterium]